MLYLATRTGLLRADSVYRYYGDSIVVHVSGIEAVGVERAVRFAVGSDTEIAEIAERSVEAITCWTGRTLCCANERPLQIVVDPFHDDPTSVCFRFDTDRVELNRCSDVDTIIHETAHALIHRLKPGWTDGVSLIIHEALADLAVVLVALRRPDTVVALVESCDGDLSRDNEAARIVERPDGTALRSARNEIALDDIPFPRDRYELPGLSFRGSRYDPHRPAQVLTGALYDLVSIRTDELTTKGYDRCRAIRTAADEIGTIAFAAIDLCGEHRVSLEAYSSALCRLASRIVEESFACHVAAVLRARKLIGRSELASGLGESVPTWCIDPDLLTTPIFGSQRFVRDLVAYERRLLEYAKAIPIERIHERADLPLLLHEREYPFPDRVAVESLNLVEMIEHPRALPDGVLVRVAYTVACPGIEEPSATFDDPAEIPVSAPVVREAFASYLFDSDGMLVIAHTDRPL